MTPKNPLQVQVNLYGHHHHYIRISKSHQIQVSHRIQVTKCTRMSLLTNFFRKLVAIRAKCARDSSSFSKNIKKTWEAANITQKQLSATHVRKSIVTYMMQTRPELTPSLGKHMGHICLCYS